MCHHTYRNGCPAVRSALQLGYRHFDTAQVYNNEVDVGEAVRDSGVPRKDVWITSKVSVCTRRHCSWRQSFT